MRAKLLPEKPLLPALSGFHYCDLLLAASERAAWRLMLNLAVSQPSSFAESSRAVSERARQTLQWAEECNASLATIALDHLTLPAPPFARRFWKAERSANLIPAASPWSARWTASAALATMISFPLASSPAPGCVASPARSPAPRVHKPTSMKLLRLPSAGRCACTLLIFILIARGSLA
jgi:hypothetical protein